MALYILTTSNKPTIFFFVDNDTVMFSAIEHLCIPAVRGVLFERVITIVQQLFRQKVRSIADRC